MLTSATWQWRYSLLLPGEIIIWRLHCDRITADETWMNGYGGWKCPQIMWHRWDCRTNHCTNLLGAVTIPNENFTGWPFRWLFPRKSVKSHICYATSGEFWHSLAHGGTTKAWSSKGSPCARRSPSIHFFTRGCIDTACLFVLPFTGMWSVWRGRMLSRPPPAPNGDLRRGEPLDVLTYEMIRRPDSWEIFVHADGVNKIWELGLFVGPDDRFGHSFWMNVRVRDHSDQASWNLVHFMKLNLRSGP